MFELNSAKWIEMFIAYEKHNVYGSTVNLIDSIEVIYTEK